MILKNDTKVKTNEKYYNRYNRIVFGLVETEEFTPNESIVAIRVLHQTGKVIPEHHEQLVMMSVDDLEIIGDFYEN